MAPLLVHQEASIPDLSAEQERNHSRRCGNSHFGKKQNKKVTVTQQHVELYLRCISRIAAKFSGFLSKKYSGGSPGINSSQ